MTVRTTPANHTPATPSTPARTAPATPARPRRTAGGRARRRLAGAVAVLMGTTAGLAAVTAPPAAAGPGGIDWFAQQGGSGATDKSVEVVSDRSGNAYVLGGFNNSFTVAGSTLTALGGSDIYLAKYSAGGTALWATRLGSATGADTAIDLAVDYDGNAYVLGSFFGTITVNGGTLTAQGNYDDFVAKVNSTGAPQWGRRIGGSFIEASRALDVTPGGHVRVGGNFAGSITAGGESLLSAGGGNDIFVAGYDTAGNAELGQRYGTAAAAEDVADVKFDLLGNLYLYGKYDAATQFGTLALPDGGYQNLFLAKIDTTDTAVWARSGASPNPIQMGKMDVGASGDMVATGGYYSSLSYDGATLTSGSDGAGFVLLANTTTGAVTNARNVGGTGSDKVTAAAFDDAGNVYSSLQFTGTVTFGGVAHSANGGTQDVLAALHSPSGGELWAVRMGSAGVDTARGIDATPTGELLLAGSAAQTISVNNQIFNLTTEQGFAVRMGDPVPETAANRYFPMIPVRAIDTRDGTGGFNTPLPVATTRIVKIAGVNGVPADAKAVVLNVTGTAPTAATHLTVFPAGVAMPPSSNLNLVAGQTAANLVTVQIGVGGHVAIYNNSGSVHVIADVAGYYRNDAAGSRLTGITPTRVLDSRNGTGGFATPWGTGTSRDVVVAGVNGIPSNATAVAMNITAVGPSAATHLTVTPFGAVVATPLSTLNVAAGETRPNLDIAKVASGKVTIKNNTGTVHVIVDVVGYFTTGAANGDFAPVVPARIADSRTGLGTSPGPFTTTPRAITVAGRGGVPTNAKAVAINVTVTGPSAPSHLTVYPTGVTKPTASNLNFVGGQTVPNAVIVKVGPSGQIAVANNSGTTHVIVDVVGWYA